MTLPQFSAHVEPPPIPKAAPKTIFLCAACGCIDVVDSATRLCRACWRSAVLVRAALAGDKR